MPIYATGFDASGESTDALLELVIRGRPQWMRDAACAESHPGVTFFPGRGEDCRPAKRICDSCLCFWACRDWSLAQSADLVGIWAGLSAQERKRLRVATPKPAPVPKPPVVKRPPGRPRKDGGPQPVLNQSSERPPATNASHRQQSA